MQYPSSRLERRQQPPAHASYVRGGGSRRRHGSRPQPRSSPSTSCLSHQPVRHGADLRLVVRSGSSNEAAAATSAAADAATAASSSGSDAPAEQPCGGGRVRRPAATGDGSASAAPPASAASAAGSHKGVPRRRRWWRGGDSSRDAPSTLPCSHAAAAADFPLPAAGGSAAAATTSTAAGRLWNLSLGRYHWPATSAAAATAATAAAAASSWTSSQPFSPAPAERHAPPQPSQLPDGNEGLFFGPPTIRRKYFSSLHWTVFAQYLFRFILPSFSSPPRLSLPTSLEEIWHLTTAGPQHQSSSSNSSSSLRSCRTLTSATLFCRGTGSPDDFSVEKP